VTHFVVLTETELGGLFDRDGPLSSFSGQIKVGYAMGIYDAAIRRDLDRMREIRNTFAHSIHPLKFTTPAIMAACKDFVAPSKFSLDGADPPPTPEQPRLQYMMAATALVTKLGGAINSWSSSSAAPLTQQLRTYGCWLCRFNVTVY